MYFIYMLIKLNLLNWMRFFICECEDDDIMLKYNQTFNYYSHICNLVHRIYDAYFPELITKQNVRVVKFTKLTNSPW